jgi:Uma2 family endonuclease
MAHMAATKVWTSDEVQRLSDDGNRYEIIDGELFVTPAPTFVHQRAIFELARLIADYLVGERVAEVLVAPADVVFSPRRCFFGCRPLAARDRSIVRVHGASGSGEEACSVSR